jgi:hypothetical protein
MSASERIAHGGFVLGLDPREHEINVVLREGALGGLDYRTIEVVTVWKGDCGGGCEQKQKFSSHTQNDKRFGLAGAVTLVTAADPHRCGPIAGEPPNPPAGHNNNIVLKQVPEELVVDFVMVLHLRRFHKGAEQTRAAIGGSLL